MDLMGTIEIETGLAINTPVSEDRTTAQSMRRALGSMLKQSAPGEPVKGVLGADHLIVAGTGSMEYTVGPGYAVCGRSGQGAYILGIVSTVTVPTDPADGINPRVDRIYIVQPDPELSDSGRARIGVAIGAPGATPALPSLPAGALELSRKIIAPLATSTASGAAFSNVAAVTGPNALELSWGSITGKPSTFTPSSHSLDSHSGALSLTKGGTGATSASAARAALGCAASSHTHPWGDITGKPATFPPSAHNHTWDSISGKPSAFTPSAHTHSMSQVSGLTTSIQNLEAGKFSTLPWDRPITWTRRAAWLGNNGEILIGHTDSTRAVKQDIEPVEWTTEQLRAIPVLHYRYIVEVQKQIEDPTYHVALELGTIAEDLHDAGLWEFVVYEGHGAAAVPVGVHYELLGLAAIKLSQHAHDRLDAFERRLRELEGASS
ncbi:hypothetical protein MN032_17865 [Agromyces atrinae]|uniref:hypothetical protein n=1 Tax=Agromyces atrinae TaxID=592376 RepID=UPI001F59A84B|nr:hypothetical protein [Agromyces atrinae]MCI2959555.1 hypothetical protein [Agromyces atrinae]